MAAQDDLQSKNDLDHVTRSVELPLIASSPTEFLQRCGRLYPDRRTDERESIIILDGPCSSASRNIILVLLNSAKNTLLNLVCELYQREHSHVFSMYIV